MGAQLKFHGGPFFCVLLKGPNLHDFYKKKTDAFYERNKLNRQNFGLFGPDKKLPRDTLGLWAIRYA
jgi:hypothetical protein